MRRFVPAPQLLVNRFTISELRRVGWRDIQAFPIQSVSHADANWIDMIQPVKVRNREFVNPVDHCRVTSCYDVEPAAASLPAGRSSELASQFVKPAGELSIFGRQAPSPTRVVYAFITPTTRSIRCGGTPVPVHAPPAVVFEEV